MQAQKISSIHAVKAALTAASPVSGDTSDDILWIDKNRHDKRIQQLTKLAKQKGIVIKSCSKSQLDRLTASVKHQGVVLEIELDDNQVSSQVKNEAFLDELLQTIEDKPLLLVLDGIQDPHNLGACMRTADAAGVDAIIIPKDRSVAITPIVRKVACGADQSVPLIQVTNLSRTLKLLKTYDIWIVGTTGEANLALYDAEFNTGLAIVMGAEGKGMRRLSKENCDLLVNIPMLGQAESLNVSVATGVILFEVLRQKRR